MTNEKIVTIKKPTLRDKKKAQPNATKYFSEEEKKAIVETVAKELTPQQRSIYFYQCQALGLNPLLNEVCAISYAGKMSIQVMRDGFLTIAHRSGKFAGLESGVKFEDKIDLQTGETRGKEMVGWAKVYHRDFEHPVYQESHISEYSTGKNLWTTKPRTMIKKVAESMALRKAFNVSGVYASEEMELEIAKTKQPEKPLEIEGGNKPATETQMATIKALGGLKRIIENTTGDNKLTKQEAAEYIKELAKKKK